jgi:hypothetical protein
MKKLIATKKPTPLTFIRFDEWGDIGQCEPAKVRFVDTGGQHFEVWNENSHQWLNFTRGDYLNISVAADVYPVAASYFAEHYIEQGDPALDTATGYARETISRLRNGGD